jgi:hypothetical protein
MKNTIKIFSAIIYMAAILISSLSFGQMKQESKKTNSAVSASTLKTNMRKLWEDHVIWTRNVILCLVDELPGTDQSVKRLLQNQVDIGNAFKPYYGEEMGKKLTELLYVHINTSAEVVKAAKAGNTAAFDEANKRWYANSDEMSEFLCKANSNWVLADMKMMMEDHLKITTDEANQRIKKDYDADILAFDKINNEILVMADVFSEGIVKQFPEKFKTGGTKLASK